VLVSPQEGEWGTQAGVWTLRMDNGTSTTGAAAVAAKLTVRERRTRSMQGNGAADRGAGSELQAVGTL
jgi:hypothetical protein